MKTLTGAKFKSKFSEVIRWIKVRKKLNIAFDYAKEIVDRCIPKKNKIGKRELGKFSKMEGYWMSPDFQVTTEEDFPSR